ncbi:hypothetical protein [Actinoplanes derwentensis]|uniref:Fibronectin type-III domain-containing protein n=1 Tax=Actinoplanes derwentensis TaxID=113562 RepID=A0A1H2CP22_9ACTN|nr:hypothetical protein [Actinoplanes derwentensis]GID88562.1 hypothetical protein Ade03nite_74860 [Actinoplanes derwentensis]SDT72069.1 hypothetical protein SAMN04489716_6321 [Actinoplanes derwentensis]
MRRTGIAITLATASLALGGCAALSMNGSGSGGDGAGTTAELGKPWILVDQGKATPAPSTTTGKPTVSPSISVSATPTPDPGCTKLWPRTDWRVFIPIEVTVGTGSVKIEWPTQYDSNYRVTAVPQQLISGAQPEPTWKAVAAGTGCTMTTTITGLTSGAPYIVWLDAPNTGRDVDGTRHLYSGRSGVIYPK